MAPPRKGKGDGGRGPTADPLASIFPGKTIALANGKTVTVRPWGAHAVLHEIPALLGRLMAKLVQFRGLDLASPAWLEENLPALLGAAPDDLEAILVVSTGIPIAWLREPPPPVGKGVTGEELIDLAAAVLQVNAGFFARLQTLRRDAPAGIPGFGSPPPSSAPASDSPSSDE